MASAHINRAPTVAGSERKMTISVWLKRGKMAGSPINGAIWSSGSNTSNYTELNFNDADRLEFVSKVSGSYVMRKITEKVFRDPTAWYHIVANIDTEESVANDRNQLWVNGVRYTGAWDTDTDVGLNDDLSMNGTSDSQRWGRDKAGTGYWSGVMSHFHYIDGTAYGASTFGETDSTSGEWKILTSPTVTYGTNGLFFKFEDSSNMDLDSGTNGFTSFGGGGTISPTVDNPSNNFSTMNPLCKGDNAYTNANLTATTDSSNWNSATSTLCAGAGKWYMEYKWNATGGVNFGIADARSISLFGDGEMGYNPTDSIGDSVGWYNGGSDVKKNGSAYYSADTFSAGDIISIALDCDNGAVYFRKNGAAWQNSGDPTSGATATGAVPITAGETYFFGGTTWTSGCNISANYGNGYFGTTDVTSAVADGDGIGRFEYAPPTGYYTLCTKNIKAYGG